MRLTGVLAVVSAITTWPAAAQIDWGPNASRFLGVQGWTGTFSISLKQSGTGYAGGFPGTYSQDLSVSGSILTGSFDPALGGWKGTVSGTAKITETGTAQMGQCTITAKGEGTASISVQRYDNQPNHSYVTIDLEGARDTYSFWFGDTSVDEVVTTTIACPGSAPVTSTDHVPGSWSATGRGEALVFPTAGFELAGSQKMSCLVGTGTVGPGTPEPMRCDVAWHFSPTAIKQLELIIEPAGYTTWRPEATKSEDQPGNKLAVKVTLAWSDGSPVDKDTQAESFHFDLSKVSHEPGVALNYPIQDGKTTADLQFLPEENPLLTVSGSERQHAVTQAGVSGTEATAVVSAFDWGAWGEIQATATLADGRMIKGHLAGDASQSNVRLPKRASNSLIADVWKQQQGVNKPDQDDSEPNPAGLAGCDGDGFTLYEEYRGFYESGKHLEGDPKKKDFFILNLIGAEAEAGIWLFTEVTGLAVHKDLTQEEFVYQERLLNKNHSDGPHRVDQHGVFLVTCNNVNGASTGITESGLRARPYLVTGICVQDRYDQTLTLGKQRNLSNTDFAEYYDRAIAHELLHSIGGEHHGEGDYALSVEVVWPEDPANPFGRPYFRDHYNQNELHLMTENPRQDALPLMYPALRGAYEKVMANLPAVQVLLGMSAEDSAQVADFLKNSIFSRDYQLGVKNGQHSGDDQCIMRYSLAELYQDMDHEDTYYLVPRGSEPGGLQLCSSATGTGVNQPGRTPQPRYFNAAPSRGSCRFWICPNDAIPPDIL